MSERSANRHTGRRATRVKVGRAVGLSFTAALFCNMLAAFGVDGTPFYVGRSVVTAAFTVTAVTWVVLWLDGRRSTGASRGP